MNNLARAPVYFQKITQRCVVQRKLGQTQKPGGVQMGSSATQLRIEHQKICWYLSIPRHLHLSNGQPSAASCYHLLHSTFDMPQSLTTRLDLYRYIKSRRHDAQ